MHSFRTAAVVACCATLPLSCGAAVFTSARSIATLTFLDVTEGSLGTPFGPGGLRQENIALGGGSGSAEPADVARSLGYVGMGNTGIYDGFAPHAESSWRVWSGGAAALVDVGEFAFTSTGDLRLDFTNTTAGLSVYRLRCRLDYIFRLDTDVGEPLLEEASATAAIVCTYRTDAGTQRLLVDSASQSGDGSAEFAGESFEFEVVVGRDELGRGFDRGELNIALVQTISGSVSVPAPAAALCVLGTLAGLRRRRR